MKTPIAVFTYNRPTHTQLALETLSRCRRLDECEIYIYCDGPKSTAKIADVEASRKIVRAWAPRFRAKVIERPQNYGLAASVVTGVTELCEQYGRVIVVEDDFALRPDFVDHMLQCLDRYADTEEVYQISGYMFPVQHSPTPDAFFLPLTTTWGWATWQRAWQIFDWQATGAREQLSNPAVRHSFDLDGCYPYTNMLKQRLDGHNSSWGILWWWAVFKAQGLVVHPRESLVWVGGFDGSGTHIPNTPEIQRHPDASFFASVFPETIAFPNSIATDNIAFSCIKKYLSQSRSSRRKAFLRLLKHKIITFNPLRYVRG